MSGGLKPEKVRIEPTNEDCKNEVATLFKYDSVPVRNPRNVNTKPMTSCLIRNWGICCKDAFLQKCLIGTKNLYERLKGLGYTRRRYPILTRFDIMGAQEFHLVTDTLGKGEAVFLLQMVEAGDSAYVLKRQRVRGVGMDYDATVWMPFCSTSQLVFRRMLVHVANPACRTVYCSVYKTEIGEVDGRMALQLMDGAARHDFTAPLLAKLRVAAGSASDKAKLPMGFADKATDDLEAEDADVHLVFKGVDGDFNDDEYDDEDDVEPVPDPLDIFPGLRLGVVGADRAPTKAAKCWCCDDKMIAVQRIGRGKVRLWFRVEATKA